MARSKPKPSATTEQPTPPEYTFGLRKATINVYIASKLKYAERLKALRDEWFDSGIRIHARWLDQASIEESGEASENDFRIFWQVDQEDVSDSDFVIVWGEPEDKLRGALVEAGMAIAMGKTVMVVADSPDYGTWQFHPAVIRVESFARAKELMLRRFR